MARRGHKHSLYANDDPRYESWPVCPYATKRECEAAMRAWKREVKDHDAQLKQQREVARKAAREVAYLEYQESERIRIAAILAAE